MQDLLSSLNAIISTNESTQIITGHVIYNLAYNYKFQLKTTQDYLLFIYDIFDGPDCMTWIRDLPRSNDVFVLHFYSTEFLP